MNVVLHLTGRTEIIKDVVQVTESIGIRYDTVVVRHGDNETRVFLISNVTSIEILP